MSVPTQTRDMRHFNEWAATYERSSIQRYFDRVHEAMLDLLPATFSPRHILDVGCGTGRLIRRAQARWPGVNGSGVDAAEGMVTRARELTPGATFHIASAEALPFPAASVDLVVSSVSLHHWMDPRKGLEEAVRVLEPGGWICLADIAVPEWLAWLPGSRAQSREGLRRLLTTAGIPRLKQRSMLAYVIVIFGGKKES